MRAELNVIKRDINTLKMDIGVLKADVSVLTAMTRNLAVVLAGHTEAFARIERQLTKLDVLDDIKRNREVLDAELDASRRERELRVTRIELRGKQS